MPDIFAFLCVPFALVAAWLACSGSKPASILANMVYLLMLFGIELALPDRTLVHGALHRFPLLLGDFEFVDAMDVVDVTICHPRVHRHAAMGLERYSTYTGHLSCLGVEGAVRATRTTTFPKSD